MDIVSRTKVLVAFDNYLRTGVYPFYRDAGKDFLVRLKEVVDTVIESDLPAVEKITYDTMVDQKYLFEVGGEGKSFSNCRYTQQLPGY